MDARNCLLYCVQYQDAFPADLRTAQHCRDWIADKALTQCDTDAGFLAVAKCFDAARAVIANAPHNKALAVAGLTSYRYQGRYGWIMIGATDHADALREAARSTDYVVVAENLQIWDGAQYIACTDSAYVRLSNHTNATGAHHDQIQRNQRHR